MRNRVAYAGVDEYNRKVYVPDPNGTYALMPVKEYERLRKVADAVERHYDAETTEPGGRESDRTLVEMFRAVDALRELEDA
jgi:hypothetical protein